MACAVYPILGTRYWILPAVTQSDTVSGGKNGGSIPTHAPPAQSGTNQLGPHVHCVNESPSGCAQFNFPSEAKEAVRAPWTNCRWLLGVFFKMRTPGAGAPWHAWELELAIRSASTLALASRPKFLEAPHSRAPQQPVRDNRHHLRKIPAAKTGQ
jgi:hypothetical protein